MATPRPLARPARLLVFAAALAVALVALPAASGRAAPALSVGAAKRQVAQLEQRMGLATEDYDQAKERLKRSEAREKVLLAKQATQRRVVAAFERQVAGFMAAIYRGGQLDELTSLLNSGSPEQFLDQVATLDRLSRDQRAQLDRLRHAKRVLDKQSAQLAAELAHQRATEKVLRSRKASIERDLAKWQALEARAGMAAAASRSAVRARLSAARPAPARSSSPPSYTGPATGSASGSAAVAVQAAYAQLGKPYVWGASGPGAFDCSGLTMYVWGRAGVSLPHSSRMQYDSLPHVSRASLRPGDLVFFYSPISHVGIYIGNGQMIHAPQTGDVVKIASIFSGYVGAARP